MPPNDERQRRLEELLDAAGRAAQPTLFGWETLPARLTQTPQLKPCGPGRWGMLPLGLAAAAVLLLALWLAGPLTRRIDAGEIRVERQSVDLTILSGADTDGETLYMPMLTKFGTRLLDASSPLRGTMRLWEQAEAERGGRGGRRRTGQALVRDRRLVLNLREGDNVVRFTDVAATLDPTSVRFESLTDPLGTRVVEQGFEYDLAGADAVLKRFLDRQITCIDRGGNEFTGDLASFDANSIVLVTGEPGAAGRATESLPRRSLRAVRLGELPEGLVTRPTLVWKLRTRRAGKHETVLTYVCGYLAWQANYVMRVTPAEGKAPDTLDVLAWVTVENTSGSTYPAAGLRLIAGDVHRVRDPWFVRVIDDRLGRLGDSDRDGVVLAELAYARGGEIQLAQRSFFEYHLYALSSPSTVRDREIKQLRFLQQTGVKATRRYVYEPGARGVAVTLLVKNEKENQLGVPLPKGAVVLEQQGRDGEAAVVGRADIDHTAIKEELELRYAVAFDVTGQHREISVTYPEVDVRRTVYELRLRNHKAEPAAVRAFARRLGDDETLTTEAVKVLTRKDAFTAHFDFTLPPNGEQVIRYTVETREHT